MRRMRDHIREIVNEEVREALREELLRWQVDNLHGMALGQGFMNQQGHGGGSDGQSASFTVQVPAPGTPGSQQPPGEGAAGPGPVQVLGVTARPGQAAGGHRAGGGQQQLAGGGQQAQGGPGLQPQAGPAAATVVISAPRPGAGQGGVTIPAGGTAPVQVQVEGVPAPGEAGTGGRTSPRQIARLLGEAQAELVNELENNLRKLKQVIGESQEIARKLEMILGQDGEEGRGKRRG